MTLNKVVIIPPKSLIIIWLSQLFLLYLDYKNANNCDDMENPFLEIEKMLADLKRQLAENRPASEWMTLEELCEYLNLSKSNIYKLTMNNEIPLYRLGRILKFKKSEIDSWISQHKVKKSELQGVEVEA